MVRIIDGVLYDTEKSDFVGSFSGSYRGSYSQKYRRGPSYYNFYIAKNGVVFCVHDNDLTLKIEENQLKILKERMNPTIYAKYWPLVIPGEDTKQPKLTKEEIAKNSKKKLEDMD